MERKFFKFNEQDILEIVTWYIADKNISEKFLSRCELVIDNGDVFYVGVFGDTEDEEIKNIDLRKTYDEIEYNGLQF